MRRMRRMETNRARLARGRARRVDRPRSRPQFPVSMSLLARALSPNQAAGNYSSMRQTRQRAHRRAPQSAPCTNSAPAHAQQRARERAGAPAVIESQRAPRAPPPSVTLLGAAGAARACWGQTPGLDFCARRSSRDAEDCQRAQKGPEETAAPRGDLLLVRDAASLGAQDSER